MDTRISADRHYKKNYTDENDREIMMVNLCVPFVDGIEKADEFYDKTINGFLAFCEGKILKKARHNCKNEDFVPYGAVLKYKKSFEDNQYLSVFTDAFVFDGKRKSEVLRAAQVWRKNDGALLGWRDFFTDRETVMDKIKAEAETQQQEGVSVFFADYKKLLEKRLCLKNFYLVPKGAAFFYDAGILSESNSPQVFVLTEES